MVEVGCGMATLYKNPASGIVELGGSLQVESLPLPLTMLLHPAKRAQGYA